MNQKRRSDPEDLEAHHLAEIESGLADLAAGRSLPHEKVRAWLVGWGTDPETLPPKMGRGEPDH